MNTTCDRCGQPATHFSTRTVEGFILPDGSPHLESQSVSLCEVHAPPPRPSEPCQVCEQPGNYWEGDKVYCSPCWQRHSPSSKAAGIALWLLEWGATPEAVLNQSANDAQVGAFYQCEKCNHIFNWNLTRHIPNGIGKDGARRCPRCSTEFVRKFRGSDLQAILDADAPVITG